MPSRDSVGGVPMWDSVARFGTRRGLNIRSPATARVQIPPRRRKVSRISPCCSVRAKAAGRYRSWLGDQWCSGPGSTVGLRTRLGRARLARLPTEAQRPVAAPNLLGTLPPTPPRPSPFCASFWRVTTCTSEGNRNDAADGKLPDRRVQRFYRREDASLL